MSVHVLGCLSVCVEPVLSCCETGGLGLHLCVHTLVLHERPSGGVLGDVVSSTCCFNVSAALMEGSSEGNTHAKAFNGVLPAVVLLRSGAGDGWRWWR